MLHTDSAKMISIALDTVDSIDAIKAIGVLSIKETGMLPAGILDQDGFIFGRCYELLEDIETAYDVYTKFLSATDQKVNARVQSILNHWADLSITATFHSVAWTDQRYIKAVLSVRAVSSDAAIEYVRQSAVKYRSSYPVDPSYVYHIDKAKDGFLIGCVVDKQSYKDFLIDVTF